MNWPLIGRQADLDRVVDLVETETGVAILGPAGVGKSRLLAELAARAEATGKTVVRASATESTRSIAFAPFVELLPPNPTQDRMTMLGLALSALRERTGQRGLLLAVDDAHHLDDASLGLLVQAVASRAATVSLTARTGETMSSDLVDLWTNGVIERIDLDPLERSDSQLLIEETLGQPDAALEEELWRLAGGNPLVLHELIEGARGEKLTKNESGVWTQRGPLAASSRLADLVASRLGGLAPAERAAMDVVAIGAPVPAQLLDEAIGDAVRALSERGLISETQLSNKPVVVPAHPLYGEILKENLSPSRRRAANARLAQATVDSDLHDVDPLRAAVWQRDAGTLVSAELAIAGATAALVRHDAALAEELVRTLPERGPVAGLLLGRSLSYQQRFDDAESILEGLAADDPDLRGEIASARAQNLGFGLGHVDQARQLLAVAVGSISDPQLQARLMNERATISAISGDFVDARKVTEQVLSDPKSDALARTAAYVTLTVAQGMTGDCKGLDSIVDDALTGAEAVAVQLPFALDQVQIMHWISMANAGRIGEATAAARERSSLASGNSAMKATLLTMLCATLDATGKHEEAAEAIAQALKIYAEADPFGLEPQARGMLALHRGQQGDSSYAGGLADLALPVPAPRLTVWVDRGRAWSLVADDNIEDAIGILINGGSHASAGEHYVWAEFCFHDVVRLGRPKLAIEHIRTLPPMPGAHLLGAMRSHAEALDEGNALALEAVAEDFASYGATLLAAETWAQAAGLHAERGHTLSAAQSSVLSMICQTQCEGSDTPALKNRPSLLSTRESQVAVAAAEGLTSSRIAEERFISVRTVDNHLSSVYRKLGVGGRDQLRSVLAPAMQDGYKEFSVE